ncbi:hypothetical protein QFZ32_000528 [Streptomyces canus]|nr:hypothetical protein [Streptomyces canus]MDQ1065089.1 hypothetical protein [Streptomyces canus]
MLGRRTPRRAPVSGSQCEPVREAGAVGRHAGRVPSAARQGGRTGGSRRPARRPGTRPWRRCVRRRRAGRRKDPAAGRGVHLGQQGAACGHCVRARTRTSTSCRSAPCWATCRPAPARCSAKRPSTCQGRARLGAPAGVAGTAGADGTADAAAPRPQRRPVVRRPDAAGPACAPCRHGCGPSRSCGWLRRYGRHPRPAAAGGRIRAEPRPARARGGRRVTEDILGAAPGPDVLDLVRRTGGLPLLLVELLGGLRDEGAVTLRDGPARLTGSALPARLQAGAVARLDTFSAPARESAPPRPWAGRSPWTCAVPQTRPPWSRRA